MKQPNIPDFSNQDEWRSLAKFLPKNWQNLAFKTGAIKRTLREFPNVDTLFRVLLMHLSSGNSLRETAALSQLASIANTSDVALLKRLRVSGEWFRQISLQLCQEIATSSGNQFHNFPFRIKVIDGSIIHEPGATGSTWRLHYALDLHTLSCSEVLVTQASQGESLKRHSISEGDLIMADRGYATRSGLQHVVAHRADVLLRINLTNLPLTDEAGAKLNVIPLLRTLDYGQVGDWPVWARTADGKLITQARLCVYKQMPQQAKEAREKSLAEAKGKHIRREDTLEAAGYVMVLTTLKDMKANKVMNLYRHRWQVELAFKRMKSLLSVGHLRKHDPEAARAWLQGKVMLACLIEKMTLIGERFSPWGYCEEEERITVAVA